MCLFQIHWSFGWHDFLRLGMTCQLSFMGVTIPFGVTLKMRPYFGGGGDNAIHSHSNGLQAYYFSKSQD